jgi:hypothetical protein
MLIASYDESFLIKTDTPKLILEIKDDQKISEQTEIWLDF